MSKVNLNKSQKDFDFGPPKTDFSVDDSDAYKWGRYSENKRKNSNAIKLAVGTIIFVMLCIMLTFVNASRKRFDIIPQESNYRAADADRDLAESVRQSAPVKVIQEDRQILETQQEQIHNQQPDTKETDINEDNELTPSSIILPVENTALIQAVKDGYMFEVKQLIDAGADVNEVNSGAQTPLMWALHENKADRVQILMEHGADIHAKDSNGETALMWAAESASPNLVQSLIKAGAQVNASDSEGYTALIYAAISNQIDNMKELITAGADVNAKTSDGEPLLILLYDMLEDRDNSCIPIIRVLLDAGIDVNAANTNGITPLMIWIDIPEVVDMLLKAHADVNARDNEGRTALMNFAAASNSKIAQRLIEAGADVNARTNEGRSVLQMYRLYDVPQIEESVKVILEHGAE